jgi:hypothetical protein
MPPRAAARGECGALRVAEVAAVKLPPDLESDDAKHVHDPGPSGIARPKPRSGESPRHGLQDLTHATGYFMRRTSTSRSTYAHSSVDRSRPTSSSNASACSGAYSNQVTKSNGSPSSRL